MFISVTYADVKRIFSAKLAGIFMESDGKSADNAHTICIYAFTESIVMRFALLISTQKKHCEDTVEQILKAMSTGALDVEIAADFIRAG